MFSHRIGARPALAGLLAIAMVAGGVSAQAPRDGQFRIEEDLVYAKPDGVELKLDAYLPKGEEPHPAVVVIHGGGWRHGSKTQLRLYAVRLARRGMAAFAINYRLAPKHKFPAQIDDCREAVRWVIDNAQRHNVDAKRVGALGYSAGGHLTAMLATQGVELPADDGKTEAKVFRLKAAVAGGAPCDFRRLPPKANILGFWLGGTRGEKPKVYEAASPAAFVSNKACPMFFFHGENDTLVPISGAKRMTERLKEAGAEAELHVVEGAGHILATLNPTAFNKSMDFMAKHLKAEGKGGD